MFIHIGLFELLNDWKQCCLSGPSTMLAGQHFYSGPSLARDDRVQSRPCNLGWTSKEEVWSHRCTKTCCLPSLLKPQVCKFMSSAHRISLMQLFGQFIRRRWSSSKNIFFAFCYWRSSLRKCSLSASRPCSQKIGRFLFCSRLFTGWQGPVTSL